MSIQRIDRRLITTFIGCVALLAVAATSYSADTVEVAGDAATAIVAVAAGGITLLREDKEGALQLLKSAAVDVGTTLALKYTIKEQRPDNSDNHSFPSLHTSVAFTSAEYLRKRYGWEYGLPAYGLASFVAFSRVEADKHHVGDVLAGAAIGIASSYLFTSPNLKFNVRADVEPGYYGVRLSKVW